MAYYAAVSSLKRTIVCLLNSSQISILPSSRKILKSAHKNVRSMRRVLRRLESSNGSEMVESLREEIRDAAYKLEDAVEFHVSHLFLSQSESLGDEGSGSLILSLDSDEVLKQELHYFADMVRKMKEACSKQLDPELSKPLPEEDDVDVSRMDLGGKELKMIGLSKEFQRFKNMLVRKRHFTSIFSISGMAGIGKTTFARKICQDPEVLNYFDCCLWVTIGSKFQLRKVMLRILAQLDHDVDSIQKEGDDKLVKYLYTSLEYKRYLIVLDDLWREEDWDELKKYLPLVNRSGVLVITRLQHVARKISSRRTHKMRFLNEEESWCLLREKVFGDESCSPQLEKAGKKIAKNCDGLPLLIITVADLLSEVDITLEYWNEVAEEKDKSIFREANDKISNILLRSYKYLRQDLKACFLYMAVFPSKCKIPASKLFNLWNAEFLPESKFDDYEVLDVLVSSNVVLEHEKASFGRGTKICSLHFSFWHACVIQSWKENFLHVISSFDDTFKEGAKSRRRLCTYNSVLFGFKEVYNLVESISSARVLICSGQYHQYPVPICFALKLLKVLDVLSVRFYKFPIKVLKLIHLKYLALTYNGKVPASISKLWNLEYLIVRRHLKIKFLGDWSYLPVEIWNMQKLRHLQVMGSCLPYLCDALLPGLLKLSHMSAHSCTEEILKRIPNLQKLGIQIELVPDAAEPLSCFDHLSCLSKLESLKCVIVNPNPATPQLVAPFARISSFPSKLKKLSLSGFGYPWEYMNIIAKFPILEVLKLRNYAFRGPEWVLHEDDFNQLEYLLLEDIDLMHLRSDGPCLPKLQRLIIKHCYKLKEIPLKFGYFLRKDEIIDSPLVANYVRDSQQQRITLLRIHSSWDDEKHKT